MIVKPKKKEYLMSDDTYISTVKSPSGCVKLQKQDTEEYTGYYLLKRK